MIKIKMKDIDIKVLLTGMEISPRVWQTWFSGMENSVQQWLPDGVTERRARAIMKVLDRMGYVHGCHCGCRGDYEITEKGHYYINGIKDANS